MFKTIEEALQYIESQRYKHTIDEYRDILRELHIQMKQPHMIQIAGTNGKGSTVNYLRSILNKHGYSVGTFTSPYLVSHNDRIRVNDEPISDELLLDYINKYYDVIEEYHLSMFEIDVLIMLDYFNSLDLDYRIIECGIGGAHDKTNVIDPEITAITNISMDHQELIGPTLYDIINEKMGIIKPHQLFFTTELSGTVLARLQEQCDAMDARMIVVPELDVSSYPFEFYYKDMSFTLVNQGIYQVSNARLALTIAAHLIKLDKTKTKDAIEKTNWAGRFERFIYKDKQIILDGAHNVPAIEQLLKTLTFLNTKIAIIYSSLKEKDYHTMIDLIIKEYPVYLTVFNDERIMDIKEYDKKQVKLTKSYQEALNDAVIKYDTIIVTGSLHFISKVRHYLDKYQEKKQ